MNPSDLRVLLCFPPQGHPTQPYLALPSLKAWLAQNGFPRATVWDLNLEAYEHFLSGPRLELALARIRARAAEWEDERREVLWPEDFDRFRLYADALAAGPYVAAHVDEAMAAVRDPRRFHERETYLWAMRTLEAGLKLASTEFWPTLFTAHNYTQGQGIDSAAELFAGVDHPQQNMFREWFAEHALARVERERPDVLGISVTYGSQLVPALTLATLVKARWPEVHVTLGGGMLAYVGHRLAATAPLFGRVDSIVVYEGERPLLELCRAVAAAGGAAGAREGRRPDLSGVSNLLWCGPQGPRTNGELLPLPIDELPCPDFGDLPLERYLSGELVLPVAPTRGCFYEKCGFCTLYTAIGPTYRERSVARLVADLQALQARHGTKAFYFIMDDLPPLMARQIPEAFAAAGLDVRWWCDARLDERDFNRDSLPRLYAAGCRKLMFGFESGSQRVLDLVEKGTRLDEAERVIRAAHEAGISATLYTMVGLPTETWEEAQATRDFIVRNAPWIGEISLQVFNLDMVSPMYRDPARYGIARVLDDPRDGPVREDLARYLEHESASGMTRAQVRAAFDMVLEAATQALPALRGDNFLFYRYKSHIFLWLCRRGRDAFRSEQPTPARAAAAAGLPERLALRPDVRVTRLPFRYGAVRAQLDRAWSDPTPLGGVARSAGHAAPDARPVTREAGHLAFVGREHRFVDLGRDVGALLDAAVRGGTGPALEAFGPEHRGAAAGALARALEAGLLVPG